MRNPGHRREEVLKAALECFLERGVEGTTMAAIRERSGASTGSIYHLFESKEAIAAALYLEVLGEYQTGLLKELEQHPGAREGIEALVRHHLDWSLSRPDAARFLVEARSGAAVTAAETRIREQNKGFFRQLKDWWQGHVRDGTFDEMPFELFLAILRGPAQEMLREWLAGRTKTDPRTAIPVLARAAWQSVEKRPTSARKGGATPRRP
ncbi:TetR/AcrR family transcriptional regulator [Myxococcus sp. MISCRS1]|jgi:AcrR family transcriptional regulator|uniref:TetR/AcrR family transcriptional regulator n=1 Tax=Myxococcus TaxID=32 RepID=UPI001CBD62AF|nr:MULTISPECIES: TetR/AcrR family transcriptional regulator [unclassified Myxococcus]MBZ4399549.1 TetR/AcrR family transcriptional regulator [Myxococcus sp. AS-1-15]MBZ4412170.1 TetR/AcrR family transcriptional regulator [Myxococcus sp. XM-1-1-1]MCY0995674.1 TetR/AcrR family transcriptional regulator [Myxococcus sp. MISCRS1]